jgi:hypothetical protein
MIQRTIPQNQKRRHPISLALPKERKTISTLKWVSFEGVSNEFPLPKTRKKRRLSELQCVGRGERMLFLAIPNGTRILGHDVLVYNFLSNL